MNLLGSSATHRAVTGPLRVAHGALNPESDSEAASNTGGRHEATASSDAPIEVCYLINHLAPDGAPTVIESLVTEISTADVACTVCFFGGDDTLRERLESAGARVVDFGATTEYPQFDPRSLPSLVSFFARESFDILHCHLPYAQSLGRVVGRVADIEHVVSTQHNVPSNYHPAERIAERVTQGLDSATVAVSGGVESAFTGHEPTTPAGNGWGTIQNGIDVDEFATSVAEANPDDVYARWDIEDADPLFVNIARYQPQKGQQTLIDAMEHVVSAVPSATVLIVGWGPLEEELRSAVHTRGLTDAVTVTGRVPEIHPYYAAADAFVLPSNFEGLPVTLLEAMAAACPIVATDIPGVREVVVDGVTGTLVAPDESAALADALIEMAQHTDREQLGMAGHQRAKEQFSIQQMATEHVTLYQSLMDRPNRGD